jgi:glutathione S-transferase
VLLAQALKPEGERDEQRVDQAREELRRCLYYLREKLDGKQYLVGNQFTLADAAFAPRMIVLGRLGFEFEPALAPVQQWVERIRARPSVASLGL